MTAAEEVSPLSISVADVTRSFKRVNIHKAVGPDGIPGRVPKACRFQLAGVFTDIFNLSLSLSVVPSCFKKSSTNEAFVDCGCHDPVHDLTPTHHQRSPAHHMDSCTTLTVALHLRLQFPSPIALTTHS